MQARRVFLGLASMIAIVAGCANADRLWSDEDLARAREPAGWDRVERAVARATSGPTADLDQAIAAVRTQPEIWSAARDAYGKDKTVPLRSALPGSDDAAAAIVRWAAADGGVHPSAGDDAALARGAPPELLSIALVAVAQPPERDVIRGVARLGGRLLRDADTLIQSMIGVAVLARATAAATAAGLTLSRAALPGDEVIARAMAGEAMFLREGYTQSIRRASPTDRAPLTRELGAQLDYLVRLVGALAGKARGDAITAARSVGHRPGSGPDLVAYVEKIVKILDEAHALATDA